VNALQIYVLNKALLEKDQQWIIGPSAPQEKKGRPHDSEHQRGSNEEKKGPSWLDLHGKTLVIPPAARTTPATRCINVHAMTAIEIAMLNGWIQEGEVTLPSQAWAAPQYDEFLMAKLMAQLKDPSATAAAVSTKGLQH
jgi:hypothetical protein